MFRFGNPEYLYLFFIIPIFIVGFILFNLAKKKDVLKLGDLHLVKQMMPELSLKRSYLKFWLTLSILGFGIIVLARPQFGTKPEKIERKGIELVIAIDVSNSMMAEDIKPNRLEKAKQMLTRIINQRKDDKVGIVVFAGEAFVQLPLTADNMSAKLFLESIDPSLIPVQGTVIGSAIDMSLNCFSSDESIDKAIVLITDGESHEGGAEEAAKQAAEKGIHISVVGIGSTEGALIPIGRGANDVKRDNENKPVVTKLNEDMCRKIAESGKGLYVHADNSNSAFKSLESELDKLEKGEVDGMTYSEYDEKYYWFAWAMLVLLFVEVCVFDKKNRLFRNVRLFKEGDEIMRRIIFISLFVMFAFSLSAQRNVRKDTHKGDKNYREQRYGAAEEKYKAAIEKYTDSKDVKEEDRSKEAFYNLGNTYYRQRRWNEAIEGYSNYQKLEVDPRKQSEAWSNIGNTYLHKAIEKAPPKDPSQQQAQGGQPQQPQPPQQDEQLPRMEDLNKSMDAYKNALRLNPLDNETRYNLAAVQKMIKDQNDKNQDDKKDQKQDKKEDQKQDQQKQQDQKKDQEQDKKEDQKNENQMSQENIEQILNAIEQDEKETQSRVQQQKNAERKQMNARNRKQNKDW